MKISEGSKAMFETPTKSVAREIVGAFECGAHYGRAELAT